MPDLVSSFYPEARAGGFTRVDGTVQFYARVNALLSPGMTVVDLGAGRGVAAENASPFVRGLLTLKGKVERVIGVDVDPAVLGNPLLDEAHVYDGATLPLADASIDVVVSDHVFEHVADPACFAAEIARVLKPGGWVCARTPYLYSALVLASTLTPNRLHARVLGVAQPGRRAQDVFPTTYRLNTRGALRRHFPPAVFADHSYTWSPEPSYHMGSGLIFAGWLAYQYVKRPFGGEVLLVFLNKTLGADPGAKL